jgi:hypothetical protein
MEIGADGAIRGEVRAIGHQRVAHGLYRLETPELTPWENFLLDLGALRLLLPPAFAFTHVTGGRLRGWDLPALPEKVPFFAAVREDSRPRRPGLICSRLTHPSEVEEIHGLPVDEPAEILLRAARDLSELDLAVMLDSAMRVGDIDEEALEEVLASGRPGTRLLRRVWERRNPRSESAGETLLHKFHQVMDVATESQVEITDDEGRFVCRADLLVTGTNSIHEYDGEVHRDKKVHRANGRSRGRRTSDVATPWTTSSTIPPW